MRLAAAMLALTTALPALAQAPDPLAPADAVAAPVTEPVTEPVVVPPAMTVAPVVVPRNWRELFAAIRAENWASAAAGIAALPASPLSAVARAELYTARNSPRVDIAPVLALLAEAPDLPQADQLRRMAATRGAVDLPPVRQQYRIVGLESAPRRGRARPVTGEAEADMLRLALDPLIKTDAAVEAETLFNARLPYLSYEARAEAAQRVAWAYYVIGRNADARRVADTGRVGASGEWAAHAAWISALASWRQNDCVAAARAFREVAALAREAELSTGGYYWAARAEQACHRPAAVAPLLKAAARSPESFYGLVARRTLGMDTRLPPLAVQSSARVEAQPNVQRALKLAEIGEFALADEHLRHQARIGAAADHLALIAVARRLGFGGAQFWLAHNAQPGVKVPAAARYPAPNWTPSGGWRIDNSWAFAHALQESNFRPGAVSPAGAVGLMQVRPGTAGDFARARGTGIGDLRQPSVNLEYGQSFIELMQRNPATRRQLLKVIAAYNAGPVPVDRWNYISDKGDPLLWIESLPYWETRYYVPAVLRNMWVYQGLGGVGTDTLTAVAQHKWPALPLARAPSQTTVAR